MDRFRLFYIKHFEIPCGAVKPWAIFIIVALVGFFSAWCMQEQGWP